MTEILVDFLFQQARILVHCSNDIIGPREQEITPTLDLMKNYLLEDEKQAIVQDLFLKIC